MMGCVANCSNDYGYCIHAFTSHVLVAYCICCKSVSAW